jgi:hypothetical protein
MNNIYYNIKIYREYMDGQEGGKMHIPNEKEKEQLHKDVKTVPIGEGRSDVYPSKWKEEFSHQKE